MATTGLFTLCVANVNYGGYVPGLKYSFGHTYGYSESRLFKSQHPELQQSTDVQERLIPYQPPLRASASLRAVDDNCILRNGVHQKISKIDECQQRKVQWTDGSAPLVPSEDAMEAINCEQTEAENQNAENENAEIQCSIEEVPEDSQEREGLRSAATQWSDQEVHRKKKYNAGTQWSPVDFSPLKTIPGYTGHLPGRHYVNPGKTFCQEMDALLRNFHPNSAAVLPLSRHNFTSALQQMTDVKPEGKDDPYFDNRPPSTYANNYPIPGYQGFVPRVRTSTSSLGIRYIKAVERSLHALHEQKNRERKYDDEENENVANSPKKLLEKRPLHTPRHRPHPRQKYPEEDWRSMYGRPPSTYLDFNKTFIPGYKGFIPHLKGSPNVVGVRYSKAALRCLEATQKSFDKIKSKFSRARNGSVDQLQIEEHIPNEEQVLSEELQQETEQPETQQCTENGHGADSDHAADAEISKITSIVNNRRQRRLSEERPYRQQHSDYLYNRKPSTYKTDTRHPIPGYQGFVPRLRDSPTTLGLRYTKAALKTLEDVHRQCEMKQFVAKERKTLNDFSGINCLKQRELVVSQMNNKKYNGDCTGESLVFVVVIRKKIK
ncbi:uncharacterized protein LOC129219016 [Uloborus diversus]|uniref:uncharacterized protein LOC129219016 n=1 Tax=Uloborus diversus TaxID=327109 RepID=UPI0024095B0A|nr:uncharacterized protein LOC129219016 [Uloborus diversus]